MPKRASKAPPPLVTVGKRDLSPEPGSNPAASSVPTASPTALQLSTETAPPRPAAAPAMAAEASQTAAKPDSIPHTEGEVAQMNSTSPKSASSTSEALAASMFDNAAKHARKNLDALTADWQAASASAQRTGTDFVASATKLSEEQFRTARAFANAKTPQDALELQQQAASRFFDAYFAQATLLTSALTTGFQAAAQPLKDRYAEVSKGSATEF